MAKISRRRLAETVVRLLREQPSRRQHILQAAAAYLMAHKQTSQWELLVRDIARELARTGSLYAEVRSAQPLGVQTRQDIEQYLQKFSDASQIELREEVDSALLSGVVIRTADHELDTSALHKLKQLASLSMSAER